LQLLLEDLQHKKTRVKRKVKIGFP